MTPEQAWKLANELMGYVALNCSHETFQKLVDVKLAITEIVCASVAAKDGVKQ